MNQKEDLILFQTTTMVKTTTKEDKEPTYHQKMALNKNEYDHSHCGPDHFQEEDGKVEETQSHKINCNKQKTGKSKKAMGRERSEECHPQPSS